VLADGVVVGRIMETAAAPVGQPWMWTLGFGYHEDRTPTHGYAATREAAGGIRKEPAPGIGPRRCQRGGVMSERNVSIRARIAEILAAGAERAEITVEQVLRELGKIGFSCIGKAVTWRNEMVRQKDEDENALPTMVLLPRVQIVPTEELDPATLDAIAEVSQNANGSLRIKMHDKHAALVSIGKHLGMFVDTVQVRAHYGVSDKPMSAEEWKKQYVREG
jgi:phage terminase small subunit